MKVKIKSIRKVECKSKRYDFEVEKNHNYFANGMLVHNCSATYSWYKNKFYVCSRNIALYRREKDNLYWKIAYQFDIKNKLKWVGKNIAIQCENIGSNIQENKYKLEGQDTYLFNVYDIDARRRYNYKEKMLFCQNFGFKHPNVVKFFTLTEDMTVNDLIEMSKGMSAINKKIKREGIVCRSLEDDRVSFKAINPEFLLKYDL